MNNNDLDELFKLIEENRNFAKYFLIDKKQSLFTNNKFCKYYGSVKPHKNFSSKEIQNIIDSLDFVLDND
jgi:uncharacterized protein YfkK (UPF0435 family)